MFQPIQQKQSFQKQPSIKGTTSNASFKAKIAANGANNPSKQNVSFFRSKASRIFSSS